MGRGRLRPDRWRPYRIRLRRILSAKFDGAGNLPGVTDEDVVWAMRIVREKPDWARGVLKVCGFGGDAK